ncbi:MAG: serine hydroxymethyltransferase [Alphaproteobacteria bacterium TMED89]|nr:serine hydroxymethyltransferase [Rhodospirillaceae bacterium]RPH15205.1 MAG: serine hydroxymethyltransferase [Alphaproteobacteria bacterium TMED89]
MTSPNSSFWTASVTDTDPALAGSLSQELDRQQTQIELIASENIVSKAVLDAQGSVFTNKYAEGYAGKRYYGGCEFVDIAEELAVERAKQLYNCSYVNVQPHSGAQANGAVMLAVMKPGDTFLGMGLNHGGHLSHGAAPNISGKWFNPIHYGVRREDGLIDYDEVADLAKANNPSVVIAGGSAYPRAIDFKKFKDIADSVGALFWVDMAHFSGLVAGGCHDNPLDYADVVTTTTHKTLRGPRGGMILTNDDELAKKFRSAVFPGLQGGPLMHVIAAKAVAFGEALQPEFKAYTSQVIENAQALAARLVKHGLAISTGGTDTHLMVVDLTPKGVTGKQAEDSLENAGITCNKNSIPFDPLKPAITSGIRLGTPAATTRGFGVAEFETVGDLIAKVLDGLAANGEDGNAAVEAEVRAAVRDLCGQYPIYS